MSSPAPQACRVCGQASSFVFRQPVLGCPVDYFDCAHCGYLQTETPHWLERAYASAINDVDTGIMWRNQLNVGRVVMTLAAYGRLSGRVIDHAGGYGILVRLLRDAGVDARWRDKYCENLVARGFEAGDGEACDLLTAFEVFEHMVHPLTELRAMLGQGPAVLLSTELVPGPRTPAPDWWYLGPEHGQHIGFFRPATLQWMAGALGCHHASDGRSLHLFSRAPVPRTWLTLQKYQRWLWPAVARRTLSPLINRDFESLRNAATRPTP